jgi:hypothetical protein
MLLDENVVREVLGRYNFTLEELLEVSKHKKPKAEQDWIYLTHHMHPPAKASEMETLHHCVMWEKKNEKGDSYEQFHIKEDKVFQHALKVKDVEKSPEVVYDHLNNAFKVKVVEIGKEKYALMTGPVKLSDIKWSDQDRG